VLVKVFVSKVIALAVVNVFDVWGIVTRPPTPIHDVPLYTFNESVSVSEIT
jgi:hypothetical protein